MLNKYPEKKGWKVPKKAYKVTNWSEYNQALCMRGDIQIWLSDDAIAHWYEQDRVYIGNGTPKKFTNFTIITCHEIRQVFHLPLSTVIILSPSFCIRLVLSDVFSTLDFIVLTTKYEYIY